MKTPHTHFTKGKKVRVVLKNGVIFIDIFVERKKFGVLLKTFGEIPVKKLKNLSIYRNPIKIVS